jgi:hypothetical protein
LHAPTELGEGHGLPSGEKLEILTEKKENLRLATAKKGLMRPAWPGKRKKYLLRNQVKSMMCLVLSIRKDTPRKSLEWRFMSGQSTQS